MAHLGSPGCPMPEEHPAMQGRARAGPSRQLPDLTHSKEVPSPDSNPTGAAAAVAFMQRLQQASCNAFTIEQIMSLARPPIPADKPQLAKHAMALNPGMSRLAQRMVQDKCPDMTQQQLTAYIHELNQFLHGLGHKHAQFFINDRPLGPAAAMQIAVPAGLQQAGAAAGDTMHRFLCGVTVRGPDNGNENARPHKRPRQELYKPSFKLDVLADVDEGQQLVLPLFQPFLHPTNMAGCRYTAVFKLRSAHPLQDGDKQRGLAALTGYVLSSLWPLLQHYSRLDTMDPDPRGPRLRPASTETTSEMRQAIATWPPQKISDPPGFTWIRGFYGTSWEACLPQAACNSAAGQQQETDDATSAPSPPQQQQTNTAAAVAAAVAAGGGGGSTSHLRRRKAQPPAAAVGSWPPKSTQRSKAGTRPAAVAGPSAAAGARRREAAAAAAVVSAAAPAAAAAAGGGAPNGHVPFAAAGCASLYIWKLPHGGPLQTALGTAGLFTQGFTDASIAEMMVGVRSGVAGAPVQLQRLITWVQRPDGTWLLTVLPDAVLPEAALEPKQLTWSLLVRPCTGPGDWRVFWGDRDSSAMRLLAVAVGLMHVRGCAWAAWPDAKLQGVWAGMELTPVALATAPLASACTDGARLAQGMRVGGEEEPGEAGG